MTDKVKIVQIIHETDAHYETVLMSDGSVWLHKPDWGWICSANYDELTELANKTEEKS